MSTSSPLPSSSPASWRSANGTSNQLAFLVHSPETVANHMPPDVDNKALARQKRRRTSKEDEDVLKAEYLKNPKPDKAARLDIVSKVALGEKEVQIWFQNKRQNDRRRSRPLDSSSSASLMSSSSNMSDLPTEDDTAAREFEDASDRNESDVCLKSDPPEHAATPELISDQTTQEPRLEEATEPATAECQVTTEAVVEPSAETEAADIILMGSSISQQPAPSSEGTSQPRTSWISNRRSASFVRYGEDYAPEVISFPNAPLKPTESPDTNKSTSRPLKRTHSFVRISTNEDGTARIVTDLDKTPSPPHTTANPSTFARAAAGLRRSYSAVGLNDRLAAAARGEPSPKMPRTSSNIGRSRDSRAWEFWCDPDSRSSTSLTTRAEQEGSGSAADAIGILRANRKILAQNQARQNTPLLSRHSSHKGVSSPGVKKSRGPMQRASTINGRFSTKEYKKGGDTAESDEFPQTESDKENWEPDAPKSVRRDRQVAVTPPASRAARQILGENTDLMSQASSIGAMLAREKRKSVKAGIDPEQDDELRQFMSGDGLSGRTNLSSAEEAGCVEGLLKLSQGQWR
ncbi:Homeobox protein yox1 [Neocucurbitaria cava]|uniref:Homeobox protein yox1 n=1 Tax=Neocucurbitaria cava TaxID=798079 RepID=A0A9W9CRG3_9PLEO|nr:Homeobox protein yox1 [Neocucurbitaria cava]